MTCTRGLWWCAIPAVLVSACGDGTDGLARREQLRSLLPIVGEFLHTTHDDLNPQKALGSVVWHWQESGIRLFEARRSSAQISGGLNSLLYDLPNGFSWKNEQGFALTGAQFIDTMRLTYQDIPIIGGSLKILNDSAGNPIYASGALPSHARSANGEIAVSSHTFALTQSEAAAESAARLGFSPLRFHSPVAAWLPEKEQLRAVYQFTVSAEPTIQGPGPSLPLALVVDAANGSVLEQQAIAFEASGQAMIYAENSVASRAAGLQSIELKDLAGDGTLLSNDTLHIFNCALAEPSASCIQSARGPDFSSITYADAKYDELVAWHAINGGIRWHKDRMNSLGNAPEVAGKGWGSRKSEVGFSKDNHFSVYVRAKIRMVNPPNPDELTMDNAQYMPGGLSGVGLPIMVVGTGWEPGQANVRSIQYIGKDIDVYLHELGHHMVYRSLRDITGQTGVIHEGLADYFVYAMTGNNKLAESIINTGNPLRQGNLLGSLSQYINATTHRKGEFISSVLWDIHQKLGADKAQKIIWDAVDLMRSDADYYNLVSSIGQAAELYATANNLNVPDLKNQVYAIFRDRGFVKDPDGTGALPPPSDQLAGITTIPVTGTTVVPAASDSGSSKKKGVLQSMFCGSIGATHLEKKLGGQLAAVVLLLLPILPACLRRRVPASIQVKVSKKSQI